MRKIIFSICALSLVFAGVQNIFAAEKTAPAKSTATVEKSQKKVKLNGTITAVDLAAGTVTIKAKKGETTVKLEENSKIFKGKKSVAKDEIKEGEVVFIIAANDAIKSLRIIK